MAGGHIPGGDKRMSEMNDRRTGCLVLLVGLLLCLLIWCKVYRVATHKTTGILFNGFRRMGV
jgi:hypothetical protein